MAELGRAEIFSLGNPHPGFGKDPNVANEFGHTVFPEWVFDASQGKNVVANNEKEKEEISKRVAPEVEQPKLNKAAVGNVAWKK